MAKKYTIRIIKKKRSYSYTEIAELFKVHVRTVQTWRKEGLKIMEDSQPHLVMGVDLAIFLRKQYSKRKIVLKSNEFFCFACRKAVIPLQIKNIDNGKVGISKYSIRLEGICPNCECKVNRFESSEIQAPRATKCSSNKGINWEHKQPRKHLQSSFN